MNENSKKIVTEYILNKFWEKANAKYANGLKMLLGFFFNYNLSFQFCQ